MRHRLHRFLSSRYPALSWTLFLIIVLLSLPGKMLPDEGHLEIPQLDKLVHLVLFGGFVFLWAYYLASGKDKDRLVSRSYFSLFILSSLLGIAMEYVQKYFIPNRDFDIYDIVADITGALIGWLFVRFVLARSKNMR